MALKRVFFYRLYLVLNIAIIWVAFSIILLYNITKARKDALETRRLSFFILAFAIIGLIVASAEAFFLKNIFRKLPIWLSTLLRMTITFLLFVIVSILLLLAYYVFSYNGELSLIAFEKEFVNEVILTPDFLMGMIDIGILAFISILIL